MLARFRMVTLVAALAGPLLAGGCAGAIQGLFDEEFLAAVAGGGAVASLPGDAPALLVAVDNRTDRTIEAMVMYRDADGVIESYTTVILPLETTARALICPIEEITLGDLSDSSAIGVEVRLGNGSVDDPYIEVEPFGVVLQEGVNYDCGDALTFAVRPSTINPSGYQTLVEIRRAEDGS